MDRSDSIRTRLERLSAAEREAVTGCLDEITRPLDPRSLERILKTRLSTREAKIAVAALKGLTVIVMKEEPQ